MWRTIDLCGICPEPNSTSWKTNARKLQKICRRAVDRGGDNVVDIGIQNFGTDRLLRRIIKRSKRIRRLRLVLPNITHHVLHKGAPKLTLLEDLEPSYSAYTTEDLQAIGRHCPLLKSLKLNRRHDDIGFGWDADAIAIGNRQNHCHVFAWEMTSEGLHADGDALAIAGTMHGLKQLQIFGNRVTNKGLQAILDGCPCLESLDLRCCFNLQMEGDLRRRCFQGIKQLRLPNDSTDDYELVAADEVVKELFWSFYEKCS